MTGKAERRSDIDWLRTVAVLLLFLFHTARIFDINESFYVQNNEASRALTYGIIYSIGPWFMPLFFVLAGASTWYALHFRSPAKYAGERFKRLFLPFVFGVLILIPPQSYCGLLNHAGTSLSYLEWYPQFFILNLEDLEGYYLGGHTWGHLWFILHLFVYSLAGLPLFVYLNGESGRRFINSAAKFFTRPGIIFLLPFLLLVTSLFPEIAGGNPLLYITFFIYGYILMADDRFAEMIDNYKNTALIFGPGIYVLFLIMFWSDAWPANMPAWLKDIRSGYIECFVSFFTIVAMLSYARKYLNFDNAFLKYAREASYPFYILHQSVIVVIGFFVVRWDAGELVKYLIITAASLITTALLYDVLVRRINIMRFLFGMKLHVKTAQK
ncbi:MAG: acyltransferase [Deltaproteobacteria bacterium]|nr:acyltransferase [Deltaproteobacteria bacterium]